MSNDIVAAGLTVGALEPIMREGKLGVPLRIQITMFKPMKIPGGASDEHRYRLNVSDGNTLVTSAMLATQNNNLIDCGALKGMPVVDVETYQIHTKQKKVFILVNFKIVSNKDTILGNPKQWDENAGSPQKVLHPSGNQNGVPATNPVRPMENQGTSNQMRQNFKQEPMDYNEPANRASGGPPRAQPGVFPISSLTPYQNKWKILVRVQKKADLRTYRNARGEGKLFSVDLADSSGEIRATAFNEQADKLYNFLQEKKMYYISGGNIKPANKMYSSLKNDYELTFNQSTTVDLCNEVISNIPDVVYNFISLDRLATVGKDTMIDVIGVIKAASEVSEITSRNSGKQFKKRELTLLDKSLTTVQLTLWGSEAEKFEMPSDGTNPVIAIKGVKVGDFGGVSLSTVMSSSIDVNPNIGPAQELSGWWIQQQQSGQSLQLKSLTTARGGGSGGQMQLIGVAQTQNLGMDSEKGTYFTVRGTVMFVKSQECVYKACPKQDCKKKATEITTGVFRCEKCQYEGGDYKYVTMLSIQVGDFTGTKWLTLFEETATQLVGKNAQELGRLKEENPTELDDVMSEVLFKTFNFRVGSKAETYNDRTDLKWRCFQVTPVDYTAAKASVTDLMHKLEQV